MNKYFDENDIRIRLLKHISHADPASDRRKIAYAGAVFTAQEKRIPTAGAGNRPAHSGA